MKRLALRYRFACWRLETWATLESSARARLQKAIRLGSPNLQYEAERDVTLAMARRRYWAAAAQEWKP